MAGISGGNVTSDEAGMRFEPGQLQIRLKRVISGFAAVAERVYRERRPTQSKTPIYHPVAGSN
jgi:hypothetical protein